MTIIKSYNIPEELIPVVPFKDLLLKIIKEDEGGFVLSKDPDGGDGGWTFAGVTAKTFAGYCKVHDIDPIEDTENFMQLMGTPEDAKDIITDIFAIYDEEFISPLQLSKKYNCLQGMLLSCAINCGIGIALQLYHVTWVSSQPVILLESCVRTFAYNWQRHYSAIIAVHPEKHIYLNDWKARVNRWKDYELKILSSSSAA